MCIFFKLFQAALVLLWEMRPLLPYLRYFRQDGGGICGRDIGWLKFRSSDNFSTLWLALHFTHIESQHTS
jgi:hypothetical protein